MDPTLSDLLQGKAETELSSYDIESKAHNRWSRKQFQAAALLFEAAARVCKLEDGDETSSSGRFLNPYCRAGICYSQGGDIARARPFLEEAINADWIGAGLENDKLMIEWCYVELLHHEAKINPDSFASLYSKAKAHCANLGWTFPVIHPKQELLMELAVDLDLKDIALEIVSLIKQRKPVSRPIRARLKEIDKLFS